MAAYKSVQADLRKGGLNYIFPCGHVVHVTQESIHNHIYGDGLDITPRECPTCPPSVEETQ